LKNRERKRERKEGRKEGKKEKERNKERKKRERNENIGLQKNLHMTVPGRTACNNQKVKQPKCPSNGR